MIQAAVSSNWVVIVGNELLDQPFEMSFIEWNDVIKKLSAQDANDAQLQPSDRESFPATKAGSLCEYA